MRPCFSANMKRDIHKNSKMNVSSPWPVYIGTPEEGVAPDHFVEMDGRRYAGTHLVIDFWDVGRIDDLEYMESVLRKAVSAADATLLHIHLHHFMPAGGISGVAVLAESHISVHTWPERGFAAFDIFMCGNSRPDKGLEVLKKAFVPGRIAIKRYLRGMVEWDDMIPELHEMTDS